MADERNRETVERAVQALMDGDLERAASGFAGDVTIEWPQSGERISGKQACLAVFNNYPGGPPRGSLRRIVGAGDVWVAESVLTYPGGDTYYGTHIFEFRDGEIVRETDYFGAPFPAPEWRAEWVQKTEEAAA